MADEPTKKEIRQKIRDALKRAYFDDADDLVDVSDGPEDSVHVVVVSRKFDGKHLKEKNDLIWDRLVDQLKQDEWGKVSLSVGLSPEELKSV